MRLDSFDQIIKVVGATVAVIMFSTAIVLFIYYLIIHLKLVRRAKKGDVDAQQILAKCEAERAKEPKRIFDELDISNQWNPGTIRGRLAAQDRDD